MYCSCKTGTSTIHGGRSESDQGVEYTILYRLFWAKTYHPYGFQQGCCYIADAGCIRAWVQNVRESLVDSVHWSFAVGSNDLFRIIPGDMDCVSRPKTRRRPIHGGSNPASMRDTVFGVDTQSMPLIFVGQQWAWALFFNAAIAEKMLREKLTIDEK